jgi:Recombinase
LWRRGFSPEGRTPDQHDAFLHPTWLARGTATAPDCGRTRRGDALPQGRRGAVAPVALRPTKCPLGYRNITGPDGKKIIATHPALAPLIAKLFEWYAGGDITLKEAARKAHAAGLAYPKSGAKVPVSTIHTLLRNRLYTGWFEWNGKLIQGRHEG